MIAASHTLDVLLKRAGRYKEGAKPTILPTLSRSHLPALCKELGFTKGAEIGVWKGGYSATFCAGVPSMHMLCVDPWAQYEGWDDGKAVSKDTINDAYAIATHALAGKNATIVRAFSKDAAKDVPDGSLDFCYVDSNHKYGPVLEELALWVPKVRSQGVIAGHDYRIFPDKPYIQVVAAVNEYTKAHGIDPWFITGADKTPSFLWVKQ